MSGIEGIVGPETSLILCKVTCRGAPLGDSTDAATPRGGAAKGNLND